jgi:hypothetical protein
MDETGNHIEPDKLSSERQISHAFAHPQNLYLKATIIIK